MTDAVGRSEAGDANLGDDEAGEATMSEIESRSEWTMPERRCTFDSDSRISEVE